MTEGRSEQLAAEVEADVRRVAERLRSLSAPRLAGPLAPGEPPWPDGSREPASRADAGYACAQALADAALTLEAERAREPAVHRDVPRLSDFAAGDVVAVTGQDLVAAIAAVSPELAHRHAAAAAATLALVRRRT